MRRLPVLTAVLLLTTALPLAGNGVAQDAPVPEESVSVETPNDEANEGCSTVSTQAPCEATGLVHAEIGGSTGSAAYASCSDVSEACVPIAASGTEKGGAICSSGRSGQITGVCVPTAASVTDDVLVRCSFAVDVDVSGLCVLVGASGTGTAVAACSVGGTADVSGACLPVAVSGTERAHAICSVATSSEADVSGVCVPVAASATGSSDASCTYGWEGTEEDVSGVCLAVAASGTGSAEADCPDDPSGRCHTLTVSGSEICRAVFADARCGALPQGDPRPAGSSTANTATPR